MADPVIWDWSNPNQPVVKDDPNGPWRAATQEEIFRWNWGKGGGENLKSGDANVPPPPGAKAGDNSLPWLDDPGTTASTPNPPNTTNNITIDQFMAAIRAVESGGNYKAMGPDNGPGLGRATGAYQFLDSTWGNYKGYRRAMDAPPEIQDERARQLMQQYYNQFGSWELVAVAWHAGPGSAQKVKNGQATPGSFKDVAAGSNTAVYLERVFGALGQPAGSFGTGTGPYFPGGVDLSAEEAAAELGFGAWMLEDPELGPILRLAAQEGWDEAKIRAAVQRTDWWRTTSDTNREWTDLYNTDPTTAGQRLNARITEVQNEANRLGFTLSPDRAWKLADESIRYGWSDAQFAAAMAAEAKYNPDRSQGRGEMGASVTDIKELGSKYMVSVSDQEAWEFAQRMVAGTMTPEGLEDTLKARSLARFPHLAEYINAGISPGDYFAEHRNTISDLLGTNITNVDLMNDPEFARILSYNDEGTIRSMTIPEARKFVRGTDRFGNSERGQAEASSLVEGMLKLFGKVA